MGVTTVPSRQIRDADVNRDDLDITTVGKSVVRKIIAGAGVGLSSTGADSGTGDVTITGAVVEDEGTPVTQRTNINFTGAGVSVADSGGKTTVTIAGGAGSFSVTEAEVDFGTTAVKTKRFTITDAAITAASKIMVTPSGSVATGRVGNDWEWDAINFSALAGTGQFILTAFTNTYVAGKRKIFYTYS